MFLTFGVDAQTDSLHVNSVSQKLTAFYTESLYTEAPIYRGKIYYKYPFKITNNGHTYFLEDKFIKGTIQYDGKFYSEINLLYDILLDQLVLRYLDNYSSIILLQENVSNFSILNYDFINIRDSKNPSLMPNGYYNSLYKSGNVLLLAKRSKTVKKSVESGAVIYNVLPVDTYFVLKDGAVEKANNKKAFLKQFKRAGNQQYLKSKNLSYRKDRENWIIALAKYYDTKI
ncbi:MAG TPA: hypothetical protein VF602_04505 [Pedobacter sp.]|jgi:hypothetical protein